MNCQKGVMKMQIVIDIDDSLYTRLFDNGDEYVADMRRACVSIRKGTPLPTPHGRLVDIEEVDRSLSAHVTLSNNPKEDWKHIYEAIEAVPTVIESEKQ